MGKIRAKKCSVLDSAFYLNEPQTFYCYEFHLWSLFFAFDFFSVFVLYDCHLQPHNIFFYCRYHYFMVFAVLYFVLFRAFFSFTFTVTLLLFSAFIV